MRKWQLTSVCILVVVFFLLQPIGAINVGHLFYEDNVDRDDLVINNVERADVTDDGDGSGNDVIRIRNEPLRSYTEQLADNMDCMMSADPNVLIPPYDPAGLMRKADEDDMQNLQNRLESCRPIEIRFGLPGAASPARTRAAAADLELLQMEWESAINPGWAHYSESEGSPGNQPGIGGFMVDETTRISVTVRNNNPTVPVSGAYINFTIYDYYSARPLAKVPTRVQFDIIGATKVVTYDFIPPAACTLYIGATIDYREDTDRSNNGLGWYGMQALIWSADFETGGYGDGSQTPNTWTGDVGSGNNEWHKTTTADNQNDQDHTTTTSKYHGDESGSDTYDDSLTLEHISPTIDMGEITDGQAEMGKLPSGYYWIPYVTMSGFMGTGALEAGDVVYTHLITDDNEANWKSQYGQSNISGNWGTQGGTQPPGWYPKSDIIAVFVGDGSGGIRSSNGANINNMSNPGIKFKQVFEGDNDGLTGGHPGIYADDFIIRGVQSYLPPYSVRLTDATTITQGGLPLLYPGYDSQFTTTVSNYGEALTGVPVKVDIKKGSNDAGAPSVSGWPKTQTITSLGEGQSADVPWSWTPAGEGDYYIIIEAGDLDQEYTPANNDWELKVYVRKPDGRVLVVDDDNSLHNNGVFFKDVEEKMLESLDGLGVTYNVYTTGWNESGPTKSIMNNYDAVIWMTGLDNEHSNYGRNPNFGTDWGITFKPEDQAEVASFLDQGDRNLWVISPGVLYDMTDTDGASSPTGFLKEYLHVLYTNCNVSTPAQLVGDPNGLDEEGSYETTVNAPYFSDKGSIIEGDSDTNGIYYQNLARTAYNSLQYSKDYNLAFFAFNYYLIDKPEDRKVVTYRVLHFFGILGGLDVETVGDADVTIGFGQTAAFRFSVTNNALLTERLNVKLVTPSPELLPKGWTVRLNDHKPDDSYNEISVAGSGGIRYFYLNVTSPATYLTNNGELDPQLRNITSGSEIQFSIRCECKKYPDHYYDTGSAKVRMGLVGNVALDIERNKGSIDMSQTDDEEEYYVEYEVTLRNVTNGEDDHDVKVSLDNPTDLDAEIYLYGDEVTGDVVTLPPRLDVDFTVRVSSGPYQAAGDYTMDFEVHDETGSTLVNSTTLTTTVEQYYDIKFEFPDDWVYTLKLDPNDFEEDAEVLEFTLELENRGNGPDTVTLEWDECDDSPSSIPSEWYSGLVEIYDKSDTGDTISEITLPAYDADSAEPGSATILIKVNIPRDEEEGRYWIDIIADSGAPKSYRNNVLREDLILKANRTVQVQMVMPELKIDRDKAVVKLKDGAEYKEGESVIYVKDPIDFEITVTNTGTSPVVNAPVIFTAVLNGLDEGTGKFNVSLAPGESKSVQWAFKPTKEGTYNFKATVNPDDEILGDSLQDNSWSIYLPVKEPPVESPVDGSATLTAVLIVAVIIVIIVLVMVLMMFFKRKKPAGIKEQVEGEIPMVTGTPAVGEMGTGGVRGQQLSAGTGRDVQMRSLAPQMRKELPPTSGVNECASCGEINPAENRFCQSCGAKIA